MDPQSGLLTPVGMIVMMRLMGGHDAHRHGDNRAAGAPDLPQQRLHESFPRDGR